MVKRLDEATPNGNQFKRGGRASNGTQFRRSTNRNARKYSTQRNSNRNGNSSHKPSTSSSKVSSGGTKSKTTNTKTPSNNSKYRELFKKLMNMGYTKGDAESILTKIVKTQKITDADKISKYIDNHIQSKKRVKASVKITSLKDNISEKDYKYLVKIMLAKGYNKKESESMLLDIAKKIKSTDVQKIANYISSNYSGSAEGYDKGDSTPDNSKNDFSTYESSIKLLKKKGYGEESKFIIKYLETDVGLKEDEFYNYIAHKIPDKGKDYHLLVRYDGYKTSRWYKTKEQLEKAVTTIEAQGDDDIVGIDTERLDSSKWVNTLRTYGDDKQKSKKGISNAKKYAPYIKMILTKGYDEKEAEALINYILYNFKPNDLSSYIERKIPEKGKYYYLVYKYNDSECVAWYKSENELRKAISDFESKIKQGKKSKQKNGKLKIIDKGKIDSSLLKTAISSYGKKESYGRITGTHSVRVISESTYRKGNGNVHMVRKISEDYGPRDWNNYLDINEMDGDWHKFSYNLDVDRVNSKSIYATNMSGEMYRIDKRTTAVYCNGEKIADNCKYVLTLNGIRQKQQWR